jgi:hypothetical protein
MKKFRAAVVGYGNIGKFTVEALEAAPDFEIAGIVRRQGGQKIQSLFITKFRIFFISLIFYKDREVSFFSDLDFYNRDSLIILYIGMILHTFYKRIR